MEKMLNKFKDENKLVSLYLGTTEQNEQTGFLSDVRDGYFLMKVIDDDGIGDGYMLGDIASVYSIEVDHKFHRRIEILYQLHEQVSLTLNIPKQNTLLEDVITACENKNLVATYYDESNEEDHLVGFVKKMDELVEIQELDSYGEVFCTSYRRVDQILCMRIEGRYEQSRRILYDFRSQQHLLR